MQKNASTTVVTVVIIGTILIVITAVAVFLAQQIRIDPVSAKIRDGEPLSFLLVIHDEGDIATTQVVFTHPNSRRIGLLDIPKDLGAIMPRLNRIDSIGSLLAADGIEVFRSRISDVLGTPIDYHIEITIDQLQQITDLIEGITVFNPDPIRDYQNLVLIPGGKVRLDGSKMVDYITVNHGNKTPQELMALHQEVVSRFLFGIGQQMQMFEQHPDILLNRMTTDFDHREFGALLGVLQSADTDNIIQQRVLGTKRVVDVAGESRNLLFPHFEGELLKDTVRQVQQTLENGDSIIEGEVIRVELLNGTRRAGLAANTKEMFEGYGFQVIAVGNADSFDHAQTQVYDRQGNIEKAQAVADIIGARHVETQPDYETDVVTDVTIILGLDFDGWKVR